MRPLIIERSEQQSRAQRYGYLSFTFLCWFMWLYLFVPLLSLLAWALGAHTIYTQLLQGLEVQEFVDKVTTYGIGIALLAVIYFSWAISSYIRFRHIDRRHAASQITVAELARSHNLSVMQIAALRGTKRASLNPMLLEQMFHADHAANDDEYGDDEEQQAA